MISESSSREPDVRKRNNALNSVLKKYMINVNLGKNQTTRFVFQKGYYVGMFHKSFSIMELMKRSFPMYLIFLILQYCISVMIMLCQYSASCQKSFLF